MNLNPSRKSIRKSNRKYSAQLEQERREGRAIVRANLHCFTEEDMPSIWEIAELFPVAVPYLVRTLPKCESPVERQFALQIVWHGIYPEPQYSVAPYRLDFALPDLKIAVEIDGHEFHSSKEQRGRDAQRDRFLSANGWRVIRFTGSEIFRQVHRCCDDFYRIAKGQPLNDWEAIERRSKALADEIASYGSLEEYNLHMGYLDAALAKG